MQLLNYAHVRQSVTWRVFLTIGLLLGTVDTAQASKRTATVDAFNPDLSAIARLTRVGDGLRLTGLRLDRIEGASTFELVRFEVFAPDARIIIDGDREVAPPDNAYFRGYLEGMPGSVVVLNFRESGGVRGLIVRGGEAWVIDGLGDGKRAPLGFASRRIDMETEFAEQAAAFRCGVDDLAPIARLIEQSETQAEGFAPEETTAAASYTAKVAVETDWEFLNRFAGNTTDATDYIGDLFAYGSTIYEAQVDTSLLVNYIMLWTTGGNFDPWTSTDCSGMLSEFQSYWNQNRTNVERTIAHFLSGKTTQCGLAWVGVLCWDSFDYGVSSGVSGSFDIQDPSAVWDIVVVNHEIGHNFDSPHTHCYKNIGGNSNPVDECYGSEGGNSCHSGATSLPCPEGNNGCGTLMSYCHQQPGGLSNISLTLGLGHSWGVAPERVPAQMKAHVVSQAQNNPGCLDAVGDSPDWLLYVSKNGTGTGTVSSVSAGIDCGSDCTENYSNATEVQLTQTSAADSKFIGWSGHGDCSDGSVTMDAHKSCTATFDLLPYWLFTVSTNGTGTGTVTSSPAGINCGSDCDQYYIEGTSLTLAASPGFGSEFTDWSGDPDCTDGNLTMVVDVTCDAAFSCLIDETLAVSGTENGQRTFEACDTVTAGNFVVEAPNGDVTFRAGNSVVLQDGFVVDSGASFRAIIETP